MVEAAATGRKLDSVWLGKDMPLLDAMLAWYKPQALRVVDVCCGGRNFWRGSAWADRVAYYDVDPAVGPEVVCSWDALPDADGSVDVLVYDPPHLPLAAASPKSLKSFAVRYGLARSVHANNIGFIHGAFLREAVRVLRPDGLVFAKIKDYVHNHRYQWNSVLFHAAVVAAGLTPCDLVIKRDPCGGNLKSGRWRAMHHVRNVHCYWFVVRKGRCEPQAGGHE